MSELLFGLKKLLTKLEGMFADLVGPLIPALDLIMSIINPIMEFQIIL